MKPKISIIVPVYKVEKYLKKCIESILNQSFKEFELILVNDGSPDKCREICESYKMIDDRIKIIHKENGGQSSARNAGLDIVQGKYIGFVDSDDWIDENMYEELYNLCESYESDIGVISSKIIYPKRTIIRHESSVKIFSRKEAMKEILLGEYFDEVVWTKLFKKDILKECRFKENIKFEDTEFTYKVINKANKVVYIGKPLYNYLKREDSTLCRADKELNIDHIYIYEEMYNYYKNFYPEYKELVLLKLVDNGLSMLNKIINLKLDKENIKKILTIRNILNKYFFQIIKINDLNKNSKYILLILKINLFTYKKIVKLLRSKNEKKNFKIIL